MRRWTAIGLALGCLALPGPAAAEDPPLDYVIEVRLEPAERSLRGRLRLRWEHPLDEPLAVVPVLLYLNAFSNSASTFLTEDRHPSFSDFDADATLTAQSDPWGWLEPEQMRQTVGDASFACTWRPVQPDDRNRLDRTLVEVTLPRPVPPGEPLQLEIDFDARLPAFAPRTGADERLMIAGQWVPKLAMLEMPGVRGASAPRWSARQYHSVMESYAPFADWDVTVDVPEGWTVGGSGLPEALETDNAGRRRLRFRLERAHAFTLVALREGDDETVEHVLPGGQRVALRLISYPGAPEYVARVRDALLRGLDLLAERLGPYPYESLTVLMPHFDAFGVGQWESPAFFVGLPADPLWSGALTGGLNLPEGVALHELAHQYFYAAVANSERDEGYLDEGFASYWEYRLSAALYGRDGATSGHVLGRRIDELDLTRLGLRDSRIAEPVRRQPSWLYYPGTWGPQLYPRPGFLLRTLERLYGVETMDRFMRAYYERYRFAHPGISEMLAVARETTDPAFAGLLEEGLSRPDLPDYEVRTVEVSRWQRPTGMFVSADGQQFHFDGDEDEQDDGLGPPAWAETIDGSVGVEIVDPGWWRDDRSEIGGVRYRRLEASFAGETMEARWISDVRVSGPGWDWLPVEIEFRFDDGTVVRDTWDGRAAWRAWRFVTPARLVEARIDPEDKIQVDVDVWNDGERVEPETRFADDLGAWIGAVTEWLLSTTGFWL